jgi:hypothetical protein
MVRLSRFMIEHTLVSIVAVALVELATLCGLGFVAYAALSGYGVV